MARVHRWGTGVSTITVTPDEAERLDAVFEDILTDYEFFDPKAISLIIELREGLNRD